VFRRIYRWNTTPTPHGRTCDKATKEENADDNKEDDLTYCTSSLEDLDDSVDQGELTEGETSVTNLKKSAWYCTTHRNKEEQMTTYRSSSTRHG